MRYHYLNQFGYSRFLTMFKQYSYLLLDRDLDSYTLKDVSDGLL